MKCRILVPPPGIKPAPPAVEARSVKHWTTRELPDLVFFHLQPKEANLIQGTYCVLDCARCTEVVMKTELTV